MESLKNLGNLEFADYFRLFHAITFNFEGPYWFVRSPLGEINIEKIIREEMQDVDGKLLLNEFLNEAKSRGLNIKEDTITEELTDSEEFQNWWVHMIYNPTYIREIISDKETLYNQDVPSSEEKDLINCFNPPVIKACQELEKRGYRSYWSSANKDDATRRYGTVVKDKNVAYILIEPESLTDELKRDLLLTGPCKFWGGALTKDDNGKYYGIWAEITSPNTLCEEVSNKLVERALALPNLKDKGETSHSRR